MKAYIVKDTVDNVAGIHATRHSDLLLNTTNIKVNAGDVFIEVGGSHGTKYDTTMLEFVYNTHTKKFGNRQHIDVISKTYKVPNGLTFFFDTTNKIPHIELEVSFDILPLMIGHPYLDQDIVQWRLQRGV